MARKFTLLDVGRSEIASLLSAMLQAREPSSVVNLMDALRKSVETERGGGERRKSTPRAGDHRAPKKADVACTRFG
jgi:non-homologous end joining protein Ku